MKKTDLRPHYVQTTPLGRADLLRCYGFYGDEGLDYIISLGPFIRKEKRVKPEKEQTTGDVFISHIKKQEDAVIQKQEGSAGKTRLHYFRVTTYRKKEDEETENSAPPWYNDATPCTESDLRPDPSLVPPPGPPLSSWSRLWPFLRRGMGDTRESRLVDFPLLVKQVASCLALKKLPLLMRKAWAAHCQVLFDFNDHLGLFFHDFVSLYNGIKHLRGLSGLETLFLPAGPLGLVREMGKWRQPLRPYRIPVPGTPVFIVSDLGCLDPEKNKVKSWVSFGRQLKTRGFSPIVLTPCPPRLLAPELYAFFRIVIWDRGKKFALKPRTLPRQETEVQKDPATAGPVEILLAMISVAVRVEPSLLRSFRYLLPPHQADVGSEAEIWHHPKITMAGRSLSLVTEEQDTYRNFFKTLSPSLREEVQSKIQDYHRHLSPAIHWEEAMIFALSTGSGKEDWKPFIRDCIRTLGFKGFHYQESLKEWWKRVFSRLPPRVWKDNDELGAVWVMVYRDELLKNEITQIPTGLDITKYKWILETIIANRDIAFHDREDVITTDTSGQLPALVPGPILNISLTSPLLKVKQITGQTEKDFTVHLQKVKALTLEKKETRAIILTTPAQEITIESCVRPSWAIGMGRDEYGLYAECEVKGILFRMRWINPGEFLMGSPEDEPDRADDEQQHKVILTLGYWLGETTCTQGLWQAVMGTNPSKFKGSDMLPVDTVSWNDCMTFIENLNQLIPDLNFCLPSEAEWEYACRAGTRTPYHFGKTVNRDQANYKTSSFTIAQFSRAFGNKVKPVEVKSFSPNQWGLFGMHGNVQEWCADWYAEYNEEIEIDPIGPVNGKDRILRGGGFGDSYRTIRSASRTFKNPGIRNTYISFRFTGKDKVIMKYSSININTKQIRNCPPWAIKNGQDEYGLYAECEVKGVTFRMRWINPGEFRMGSPEDEPDRADDEKQHKVILTRGYWLGETTCTQELWQVVMGANPSKFKGINMLPVDTVSWDDCKEFIKIVNKLLPGAYLRLPAEAEWEYACRAGTKTPFSFGNNITPDQVNYNGNYPYTGGKKGEFREKTVVVKSLPPNPWGLYEMHGNLLEWCEDWYREYSGETETDPIGPENGVSRVLRGGCWDLIARSVRSAYRYLSVPDSRFSGYGFRLAGGQNQQE